MSIYRHVYNWMPMMTSSRQVPHMVTEGVFAVLVARDAQNRTQGRIGHADF